MSARKVFTTPKYFRTFTETILKNIGFLSFVDRKNLILWENQRRI